MEDLGLPVVIDLGKTDRKQIKALKKGSGKLKEEVIEATAGVKSRLGADADGKELLPIVVIYKRKRRTVKKGLKIPMLF
jgi:hypothetical protein